nr:ABC transporter permease [Anaerolineae bacterium]
MSQNTISLQAAIAEAAREQTLSEKLKWFVLDTLEITKRNLIHYIRLPQLIFFSFIQPIIFVLLFTQVFGGAMGSIISLTYGTDYVNYLLPGIFVQTALFSGAATTVGLATDLQKGMIDRFRSLPMSRAAVLTGRTIADSVRSIFTITIMIVVGSLLGFRFSGTFAESALAVILCILWGYCCTWIFAWIGVLAKDPETAQTAGFIWVFPLQFASSIFVPCSRWWPTPCGHWCWGSPPTSSARCWCGWSASWPYSARWPSGNTPAGRSKPLCNCRFTTSRPTRSIPPPCASRTGCIVSAAKRSPSPCATAPTYTRSPTSRTAGRRCASSTSP